MIIHKIPTALSQVYLIETSQCLTLVDTGAPVSKKKILRKLKQLNRYDLNLIYITHAHFDHYGCANSLRDITGAKVAIHHADANDLAAGRTELGYLKGRGKLVGKIFTNIEKVLSPIPTRADMILHDGDELTGFGFEGRVLHTPGHTSGSSCLIIQNKYGFAGDLLSSNGKPHVQKYFAQDWSQIPVSLKSLKAADPELVYTGHGKHPIKKNELQAL